MTIQDLNDLKIQVKGFTKLSSENKIMLKKFIYNYLSQYEYPEQHIPVSVSPRKGYLKVTFKDYWLHVVSPSTWY